jgi:hypothetical protein
MSRSKSALLGTTPKKNSALINEFGIDARASDLFKLFSPTVLKDSTCPYCNVNLWQNPRSKTSCSPPRPYCPSCGHEHTVGTYRRCGCRNGQDRVAQAEADIAERKRRLIRERYPAGQLWEDPDPGHLVRQLTLCM